ncbi:MAG: hypothetical protein V7K48_25780 [Nostoc sp.]|uniref:hypothetical protein n=1 Tax=Nostoc sp. TaxID=1180 RepID=UPI002FF5C4DF
MIQPLERMRYFMRRFLLQQIQSALCKWYSEQAGRYISAIAGSSNWRKFGLRTSNCWNCSLLNFCKRTFVLVVIASIFNLLGQNWMTEAIAKASLGLPLVLVCAKNLFARN